LAVLILLSASTLLGSCGKEPEQDVAGASSTTAVTDDDTIPDGVAEFCSAVEVLDQADGTTDAAIPVDEFAEVRRTAPAEIRDDAIVVSDNIIIYNYPSHVEPTMRETPVAETDAARARLGAYVDEHCALDD
jgi:hypothetical protein